MLKKIIKKTHKKFTMKVALIGILIFFVIYPYFNICAERPVMSLKTNRTKNKVDFVLNPGFSVCGNDLTQKDLLFISFVPSAPHLFEKRNEIRNTWANQMFEKDLRNIFSIGLSDNETINQLVKREFKIYRDLIQIENFRDSYNNFTYKLMKTFDWISKYCSKAKFIIKIDDDEILNTPKVIGEFRNDQTYNQKSNSIFAMMFEGIGPDHSPSSKWYVSPLEFNKTYPPEFNGIYPKYPQGKYMQKITFTFIL